MFQPNNTKFRQEEQQQLVYRIDCDKHSTLAGAPLILVLRKESAKPILVILLGTQTYPSRTPVIKDQRRNKGQGYILQDERKPAPAPPAAPPSVPSAQTKHPTPFTLLYLSSNRDPYQHQPMHHQQYPADPSQGPSFFGQPAYHLSYNNQAISWGQQQQIISGDRTYPSFQPLPPPPQQYNQAYALPNDNRMESTMETPTSPYYNHYDRRMTMMPIQQDNNVRYAPWNQYDQQATPTMQSNPVHPTPSSAVPPPPPAFRTMNGPRPSKSVSFAPLPDHVVV